MNDNLYKILGVDRDASFEEIKSAFKKLAQKLHPDKNGGDKNKNDEFLKVNSAYKILKDKEKRKIYDESGTTAPPGSIEAKGISMFLENVFNIIFNNCKERGHYSYSKPNDFETVRIHIKKIIIQLKSNIEKLSSDIANANTKKSYFINRTDPLNLIENMIADNIADLIRHKKSQEEQILVSEFALKYCDHYELIWDIHQLSTDKGKLDAPV